MTVPIVLRQQSLQDGRVVSTERASEFDMVRFQLVGSATTWVFIGDDEQRMEVSAESAARLQEGLSAV